MTSLPGLTSGAGGVPANLAGHGPLVAPPAPLAPALAALLGSEDTLFRDPFADFIPSGR